MRILLVDDSPVISEAVKEILEEDGFMVDIATDGVYGLEMAIYNLREYDIIILDWMLPGITGLDICKYIRNHSRDLPVIFLTANESSEDAIAAFDAGATDYIHKPFAFDELLARIHVILRHGKVRHCF